MRPSRPPMLRLVPLGLLLTTLAWRTAAASDAALGRFEFTEPQMGVPFRVVLYAPDPATATNAAQAVFARIRALNDVMSDYEFDSELSRLSRTAGSGDAVPVSAELWTVLGRAQDLARRTDGAFDVTVGPCVSVWRRARRDREMPTAARLAAARAATGWQHLELDAAARTARLRVPRMRLDLGGIAKGYAADQGLKVLADHGITRALISGGGDLAVSEPPPGEFGWRIELPPLDAPGAPAKSRFVRLRRAALATSGDVFQYVEIDGVRYSHIVDPRTGLGLTHRSLVTVIAPDGLTADSLSTAISVLGPERGRTLARREGVGLSLAWQQDGTIQTFTNRRFRRWLED
ncbi:MAG: FAD:protein FMN transferase [Verrucomicrobia bacterium]|nr:FAD:protein FMN transferase [Verrucomicrobiota bacterium]